MLTQAGPKCDVCGEFMLLDKSMNWFTVPGITTRMCCHDSCKPKVELAISQEDWKLLPEGPLRKVFEEQNTEESNDA